MKAHEEEVTITAAKQVCDGVDVMMSNDLELRMTTEQAAELLRAHPLGSKVRVKRTIEIVGVEAVEDAPVVCGAWFAGTGDTSEYCERPRDHDGNCGNGKPGRNYCKMAFGLRKTNTCMRPAGHEGCCGLAEPEPNHGHDALLKAYARVNEPPEGWASYGAGPAWCGKAFDFRYRGGQGASASSACQHPEGHDGLCGFSNPPGTGDKDWAHYAPAPCQKLNKLSDGSFAPRCEFPDGHQGECGQKLCGKTWGRFTQWTCGLAKGHEGDCSARVCECGLVKNHTGPCQVEPETCGNKAGAKLGIDPYCTLMAGHADGCQYW